LKNKLKALLKSRRGISMTEVVIAMTMVLLVTGAAITVVTASVHADVKYRHKSAALTACENAAECVRFAKNGGDLEDALKNAGFEKEEDGDSFVIRFGEYEVAATKDGSENYAVKLNGETIY